MLKQGETPMKSDETNATQVEKPEIVETNPSELPEQKIDDGSKTKRAFFPSKGTFEMNTPPTEFAASPPKGLLRRNRQGGCSNTC